MTIISIIRSCATRNTTPKTGFSTKIPYARKRGVSGRKAHPSVLPRKRNKMSGKAWHEEFVLRCLKRGETVEQIAARWK